jgi:hypothetical protein
VSASGVEQRTASAIHLRTLALMTANQSFSVLEAMGARTHQAIVVFDPERPSRYTFTLDGTDFATTLIPRGSDTFTFSFSARLGMIPYTAECARRRSTVIRLIGQCRDMPDLRFVPGVRQSLWLISPEKPIEAPTPDTILYETLEFLRQVRPFIRLVQPHLEAVPEAA